jgi:hypothetical protein
VTHSRRSDWHLSISIVSNRFSSFLGAFLKVFRNEISRLKGGENQTPI